MERRRRPVGLLAAPVAVGRPRQRLLRRLRRRLHKDTTVREGAERERPPSPSPRVHNATVHRKRLMRLLVVRTISGDGTGGRVSSGSSGGRVSSAGKGRVGRASCRDLDVPAWLDRRVRRRTREKTVIERPLALPAHAAAIEAQPPRLAPLLGLFWPRVPDTGKLRTLRKLRTTRTTHARLQSCVPKRTREKKEKRPHASLPSALRFQLQLKRAPLACAETLHLSHRHLNVSSTGGSP